MAMRVGLPFTALLLAACPGGGTPARAIEPKMADVGTADPAMRPPSIEACKGSDRHDLMVLDWTPELRGDLEVAMKQGLAVLSYDCKSVKLVSSCTVDGAYNFIGTTRREKKIELNDADEVAANLPVGGLSWLSDVGGKIARERALLAQMVMVGKRASAKKRLEAAELDGCDGATHYIRAVTVGAFAVASGSRAELSASASVFGKGASGSSKSSTKIAAEDGDLESCQQATPDSTSPPAQCGALVRVEIEPIGAVAAADPDLAVASCAPGFAMSDGRCVKKQSKQPHQCKPGDADDCAAQCKAGDARSCATLAVMHREGVGAAKDWAKAAELGQRACERDDIVGCRVVAAAKLGGQGVKKDRAAALELLGRACEAGDGMGCVELGVARLGDKKLAGDAQYAFRRACYGGGEYEGCTWLGTLYAEGKGGMNASPKLAVKFFEKGCKEGSAQACFSLGELLKAGKGMPKDPAKAKELFAKACNAGHEKACKKK
jgi:uncharacterized protein